MAPEADSLELLGLEPDERLLGEDLSQVPESFGRPEELRITAARKRVVGFGAAMTGITLVLGVILIAFGGVDGLASGFSASSVIALFVGLTLIATHWGWVHMAELSANKLEARSQRPVLDRRRAWLSEIEPYTHLEVSTRADRDGSITIVTNRHRPVRCGERTYTFVCEVTVQERHAADEPAASVTERAELLRRQAAADTARARRDYEEARAAYDAARIAAGDEAERVAVLRAASQALSERINTNLREPPLTE